MKKIYSFLLLAMMLLGAVTANAVTITKEGGWFEAAYVEWTPESGATYEVYVKGAGDWEQLDGELLRNYGSYMRADAVGLKAGTYQLKVVSSASGEKTTSSLTVQAHDRSGFAHVGMPGGIGAYKNDGTLKDGAKVLYVTANNAKTVSTTVKIGSKDTNISTYTGLQDIITAYQKGYETTPLDIRIIGTIKAADMDRFDSKAEGLQVKGKGDYSEMPITIEGIGEDAAISGFGILLRGAKDVEIRNFAIMLCMDDCLSLDTKNSNIWIHNMDFFYGNTGGDSDQAKGDGTVDIKAASKNVTVSYNHFYDAGKCSLGGMSNEVTTAWHTYHHNWFDHSDSRHPRIRVQFFHVYNNYYDGVSKYGIGAAEGGTAFVEANYFRNTKYPMLSSKQGTDAEGDGTFSGEPGGVIKAYNNIIKNERKIQYYDGSQTDGKWDAVLVTDRNETVSAVAFSGGTGYNNDADQAARSSYIENKMDDPADVPAKVKQYAGRMNGGDITWTFNNSLQDENYAVISELKGMLIGYKSTLVGLADGTEIANGGVTERVNDGDGKGVDPIDNENYVPSWAGGGGTIVSGKPVIGSTDDYFWFNSTNETKVNEYKTNGVITGGTFAPTQVIKGSDGTMYSDYTGSIRLAQNEAITFYHENGIVSLDAYVSGSGSQSWQISYSNDGTTFTNKGNAISGGKGVHPNVVYSGDAVKYVRITNNATGNRDIQGIKLFEEGEAEPDTHQPSDLAVVGETSRTLSIGETSDITITSSGTGSKSITSSKTSVAIVEPDGNGGFAIKAVGEGDAEITITQVADDNYKKGVASIRVTVVDPRSDSDFNLTSDGIVSIKEGETSQIATTGAAGTVTYSSNKTSVATVSSTGLITAVATGTATITVNDPGTANVKAGSVTVTVNVIKDMTGTEICHFTGNQPSSSMVVKNAGSYSSSKGSVTYNNTTYNNCLKMESSTKLTITPSSDCKVTLIFGGSTAAANKSIKIDGESKTLNADGQYTFDATAATTYTLTKGDPIFLFLVVFEPTTSGGGEQGGGEQGGGEQGGGEQGGGDTDTSNKLINYPTKKDGVGIKGSSAESSNTIQLKNGYIGKVNSVEGVHGNGILISVEGGFKAGDIITVAGNIKNTDASKRGTVMLATITEPSDDPVTEVHKFEDFENLSISGKGVSGDQTFTLTEDYAELWIVRDGNTTVNVTKIVVERPTTDGIDAITSAKPAKAVMYDLQGRRIGKAVKGQMYILNGKKYIKK